MTRVTGPIRTVEGGPRYGLPSVGPAPSDAVALVARGFDAACGIIAYGCTDVHLERGGSGDLVVHLRETGGAACAGDCVDSRCMGIDAGGR